MGRAWLAAIAAEPAVELVGLVDLDVDAARAALADGATGVVVGTDLAQVAAASGAEAVIDVAVPQAHHPLTTTALFAGLPVLGEKPVAETLPEALSLAAASRVSGTRFVVSQSRRYNRHVFALREQVRVLGDLGSASVEFFKAPRFGGFREQMPYPLLVDMAIHQFDLARFLLAADPVAVYCESFNPPWSWFRGDASAEAVVEMDGGVRLRYSGSWCAPGHETSWNGRWRITGERGTALWDGDHAPELDGDPLGPPADVADPGQEIVGSLAAFARGVREDGPLMCEVDDNVLSLATVFAAIDSARTGERVLLDDVLQRALSEAIDAEQRDDVRAVLASWTSVREALADRSNSQPNPEGAPDA